MTARGWLLAAGLWLAIPAYAQAQQVVQTPPDYPRIKLSGLFFGDLYYNLDGNPNHVYNAAGADAGKTYIDTNGPITQDLSGAQLRRIYLQVDDDFNVRYTMRVRFETDGAALTSNTKLASFAKNFYLQAKSIVPRGDAFIGLTNTPTFEDAENFWQYRSIEKTLADFHGVAPSSDGGLGFRGFLDPNHTVGYWAMVGNGTGQRNETNRYKRGYLAIPLQWKDLRVEPYADWEDGTTGHAAALYKVFAGYEFKRFGVGGEWADYVVHTAPPAVFAEQTGYSIFARGRVTSILNGFARWDYWDPNKRAANRVTNNLWVAGVDWSPVKDVHLEPNLEGDLYHGHGAAPAGVPPAWHSLQARITVYVLFR
jgi:hypothetical protein